MKVYKSEPGLKKSWDNVQKMVSIQGKRDTGWKNSRQTVEWLFTAGSTAREYYWTLNSSSSSSLFIPSSSNAVEWLTRQTGMMFWMERCPHPAALWGWTSAWTGGVRFVCCSADTHAQQIKCWKPLLFSNCRDVECVLWFFFFLNKHLINVIDVTMWPLRLCSLQPCYQKARQWLLTNIPSVLVFGACIGVVQVSVLQISLIAFNIQTNTQIENWPSSSSSSS